MFQVVGFVMWSINREGGGPAKAYQFLDGKIIEMNPLVFSPEFYFRRSAKVCKMMD